MQPDNVTALVPVTTSLAPASVDPGAFFSADQRDLIKRQIAKGCTDDELKLFMYQCARTGLDPFSRQIYALSRREKDGDRWVDKMSIQTGIDGLRLIADRTGRYVPGKETTYDYDSGSNLRKATAYVLKRTGDGTWHEVAASAFYGEYVQVTREGKPTRMWAEKPHIMLGKCAEALALRKAFPAEMSGLYTSEEMDKADEGATYEPPRQATPPVDQVDERVLRIQKLCLMKAPDGMGWSKAGAVGWLKKRFGKAAPADLTDGQKMDAQALLVARLTSDDAYTAKVAELAAEQRCLPDPPDGVVDP